MVQEGVGASFAWLLSGEVGEIVLCPLAAQLSSGSCLFPLTTGETEAHKAKPIAQGHVKIVRDPVWSPDALILFVAFPKISPARETEAAELFVGLLIGGDSCVISHKRAHIRDHICVSLRNDPKSLFLTGTNSYDISPAPSC